jgi:sarcosine oxidase subunit beta
METQKFDAIIIGCGIIGNCIAFELSKKGYKTLSVDKLGGSGFGSTSGSCAIVRAHYSTLEGVAQAWEGFQFWENWADYLETEDPDGMSQFKCTGSVFLKTQAVKWKNIQKHYDAVGVEYEDWDIETLKAKVPLYDFHEFWPPTRPEEDPDFNKQRDESLDGALFCPRAGYMSDPKQSCKNVEYAARQKGTRFIFNAEVKEIHKDSNRVTGISLTDGTRYDAPVVINASGPHSFIINKLAGVYDDCNIKTRALRHEVAFVSSPENFDFEHEGHHTSDSDNACYMRPEVGNAILIGSEDPECDKKDWIDDPDDFNRDVTDSQWKAQVYRAARRIPSLPIPNDQRGFAELYDVSDDWIPIYDKSDLQGFYLAVGTSGNQYKNGPIAGKMMSELIDKTEKGELDHDQSPLQYKLEKTQVVIDMGAFSRNRQINRDSSFSVIG